MTVRHLTSNISLLTLLVGCVMVVSAGIPSPERVKPVEYGMLDRLQAQFYGQVVMDYKHMAPWATTAGYDQPALVLGRGAGASLGARFADATMTESIARHDWTQRQRQAAVMRDSIALNAAPRAQRPAVGRREAASATLGAFPPAPESPLAQPVSIQVPGMPADVPYVSPTDAIGGAAKSLTDVDAALQLAIAAGG